MESDVVPAALLVPPEAHGRGFDHHEAALVLDGYLRRLASQNARCRAVLARLARRFLARSGHHELGFARLGDYGLQQLGMSAREIQSLAAVSMALDHLPSVRAAFERGAGSWSQARLLIGGAAPAADVYAATDWAAVVEATPEDVEQPAHESEALDAAVYDERLRPVVRAMHRIDWQMGRLLRVFLDRRLYRLMLFSSAARYLTERLGIGARKARALVAGGRKTGDRPA